MFALASTLALIIMSVVGGIALDQWRAIRASDRFIDELARGLPYDHPALNDDLVRTLDTWAHDERVRLIRACFEPIDTATESVDTPYDLDRG